MRDTILSILELGLTLYEARAMGLISMNECLACDAWVASHISEKDLVPLSLDVDRWASDAKKFIESENWNEVQFLAYALWDTISESYKLGGKQSVDAIFVVACGLIGRAAGDAEIGIELYRAH